MIGDYFKKKRLNNKNPDIRLQAVDKICDQLELADLVILSPYENVWQRALEKITDQAVLCRIIENICQNTLNEESNQLQGELNTRLDSVLVKMNDPAIATELVQRLPDQRICLKLLSKITNQNNLAVVAMQAESETVAMLAVKTIENQSILAKIILQSDWRNVREAALIGLNNKNALLKLLKSCPDQNMQSRIFTKLKEKKISDRQLRGIINTVKNISVQLSALREITSIKELILVNRRGPVYNLPQGATERAIQRQIDALVATESWEELYNLMAIENGYHINAMLMTKLPAPSVDSHLVQLFHEDLSWPNLNDLNTIFDILKTKGWTMTVGSSSLKCSECQGTGQYWVNLNSWLERDVDGPYPCSTCESTGKITKQTITCSKETHTFTFTD